MTNQLVHISEAHLGHQHTHLLSHKHEVVDNVLRQTLKLLPQNWILRCNADRTGVEVALAHHDAAHGNERCSGKAKPLCAKKCCNHHITARPELAISLQGHTAPQAIENQGLMCFGQTNLPWSPGMLDARPLGGSSTTIAAADQDVVSFALGNSSRHNTYTDLTDELDTHTCIRVGILEVENQLSQVLNGVDVVVRRGRDESNSRGGVSSLRDASLHLLARKLSSLTRLGALGHFDLELLGIRQILHCNTKASRSDLLDG
mmetsp:Transcript_17676/g.41550  ORF Transcript_17676/g.41550 Transcript_17676/m.41550 type:complete len:260 (+) Transcript_17676:2909-3688(+)